MASLQAALNFRNGSGVGFHKRLLVKTGPAQYLALMVRESALEALYFFARAFGGRRFVFVLQMQDAHRHARGVIFLGLGDAPAMGRLKGALAV